MRVDGVSIRAYEPQDLEACRDLWRELTQRHRDIYDDQTIGGQDPGSYFDEHLAKATCLETWVGELDGKVVGFYSLIGSEGADELEIDPVVVRSDLRSRGIGRTLLAHAVERCRERGAESVSIRPVARNVEALQLYHEVGFTKLGHIDMFMELTPRRDGTWKSGVTIHGRNFEY
jgi:GNAT superfamily N-acetyltransferase